MNEVVCVLYVMIYYEVGTAVFSNGPLLVRKTHKIPYHDNEGHPRCAYVILSQPSETIKYVSHNYSSYYDTIQINIIHLYGVAGTVRVLVF